MNKNKNSKTEKKVDWPLGSGRIYKIPPSTQVSSSTLPYKPKSILKNSSYHQEEFKVSTKTNSPPTKTKTCHSLASTPISTQFRSLPPVYSTIFYPHIKNPFTERLKHIQEYKSIIEEEQIETIDLISDDEDEMMIAGHHIEPKRQNKYKMPLLDLKPAVRLMRNIVKHEKRPLSKSSTISDKMRIVHRHHHHHKTIHDKNKHLIKHKVHSDICYLHGEIVTPSNDKNFPLEDEQAILIPISKPTTESINTE